MKNQSNRNVPSHLMSAQLLIGLLLSGCSYLPTIPYINESSTTPPAEVTQTTPDTLPAGNESVAAQSPSSTSKVAIQDLELASSDIEILWEVPEDSVDGFLVRWGTERERLESENKLTTQSLETIVDPQRGQVFRHVLRNVPADRTVYVNIAAYRGSEVSPPSRLFEVPATGAAPSSQN